MFSKKIQPAPAVQTISTGSMDAEPKADAGRAKLKLEKQAISLILKKLKTNWESEPQDEDVMETVVLPSLEMEPEPSFDDDAEKTMIMSVPAAEPDKETEPDNERGFDEMEETIIMSPGTPQQKESEFFGENDDLDKTVVINPKK